MAKGNSEKEEFVESVKEFVDKNGSAAITFNLNQKGSASQEYEIMRNYSFGRETYSSRTIYDRDELGDAENDCRKHLVAAMDPYIVTFTGRTATVNLPKKSLEGRAGEQGTLF